MAFSPNEDALVLAGENGFHIWRAATKEEVEATDW